VNKLLIACISRYQLCASTDENHIVFSYSTASVCLLFIRLSQNIFTKLQKKLKLEQPAASCDSKVTVSSKKAFDVVCI
jgi:hypothetical protein